MRRYLTLELIGSIWAIAAAIVLTEGGKAAAMVCLGVAVAYFMRAICMYNLKYTSWKRRLANEQCRYDSQHIHTGRGRLSGL